MAEVSEPPRLPLGAMPTVGELELTEERRAVLGPKLEALLAQLRQLEDLERPELEPAPTEPRGWDADERR
jgi:hypothetical protein